jgi:hypothetical protein
LTGALSNDNTPENSLWDFCGVKGNSMEELQFTLVKGKCFPGDKISATELCCGNTTSSALFTGSLVLNNVVSDVLTEYDSSLIEFGLAEAFSSVHKNIYSSIILTSWELSESTLTVQFRMSIDPSVLGIVDSDYAALDSLASELYYRAQNYANNGHFLHTLQSGLAELPLGETDVLTNTQSVSLGSLTYIDSTFLSTFLHQPEVKSSVANDVPLEAASIAHVDLTVSASTSTLNTFVDTLIPLALVFCGVVVVGVVSTYGSFATRTADSSTINSNADLLLDESTDNSRAGFLPEEMDSEIPNFA